MPPNFLFLLADQHRPDWLGSLGTIPVRTPHLDALAQRGVLFTRAYCASPVCGPSRACLASGMFYERCGVPDHSVDYPLDHITYYQLLRNAGYHVAGCGKFDLHKSSPTWGLDGQHLLHEWGFTSGIDNAGKHDAVNADKPRDPYMAFLAARGLDQVHAHDLKSRHHYLSTDPTPLPDDAYCDNWIGANGLALLDAIPHGQPWHLVVNFAGPHEPMDITASMHAWYRNPAVNFPLPINPGEATTPEQHMEIRRNYAAMIENIDRITGEYLSAIQQRGELDNTIIVYSSDHGEMLGDHARWEKSCSYEASAGIPLIIAGPGIARGIESRALASLIDIGATFLDYAGVPKPAHMESRSLRPVLESSAASHRDHIHCALGPWRMARDERYKLIEGFPKNAPTMLFDLQTDSGELHNIAPQNPAIVERLRALL